MKITLVIPRLAWGGGARSTLDLAKAQLAADPNYQFSLIVLDSGAPPLLDEVRAAGIRFITAQQPDEMRAALQAADIVHVNYWNTPEMYAWFRAPQPPMRAVLTLHIAGDHAPQILTAPLVAFPDWLITTTLHSLKHPVMQVRDPQRTQFILPGTFMPAAEIVPPPHAGLRVGYAGTVEFGKMHADYVALCGAVRTAGVKFPVAGGGDAFKTLKRQAQALGIAERFEWLGYRSDIMDVLATFDLLGYPLDPYNYAAGELIVQQAMWLGVPPVLLDYGAPPLLIENGETGIVAREQAAYVAAVENLCENETQRRRLSQNARAHARAQFGAEKSAATLSVVYEGMMQEPKRERVWTGRALDPRFPGASALGESFGTQAGPFERMLMASADDERAHAEYAIAHSPPRLQNVAGGGILDYRRAYPRDPLLRLWTGLILGQQSRYALAAAEFFAAQKMGLDNPRLEHYLGRMIKHQPLFIEDAPNA